MKRQKGEVVVAALLAVFFGLNIAAHQGWIPEPKVTPDNYTCKDGTKRFHVPC